MSDFPLTGGCQCGAVRFSVKRLGRPSICHCRMCQKATGGPFGAFVDAEGVTWTRGAPSYFQSSNSARRGFCAACGTPLSFEALGGGWPPNLSIAAFDHADRIRPRMQMATDSKLPWLDEVAGLPGRPAQERAEAQAYFVQVRSRQHPDHDTETWPAR